MSLLAQEKIGKRQTNLLNTVIRDSLGTGVPRYEITQLKRCPVDRLGQYLDGTCSHHIYILHFSSTQFASVRYSSALYITVDLLRLSTSVHFSLGEMNSKQLPVSLRLLRWLPHRESTSLRVVT